MQNGCHDYLVVREALLLEDTVILQNAAAISMDMRGPLQNGHIYPSGVSSFVVGS